MTTTLVDLLRERAESTPDRLAFSFLESGDEVTATTTWAELERDARRIAAALQRLGSEGDRALLLYPSGLDFVRAFFGCLYAKRIAVPVYPPHPARLAQMLPRLFAIARDASPRLVLTTSPIAKMAMQALAAEPSLGRAEIVATDAADPATSWRDPGAQPDTLAFLQYTSGSTAVPKGVMVSHANLVHNSRHMAHAMAAGPETILVSWLPLYHDMGLIGFVIGPVFNGCACYLMSPLSFLQRPLRWLEAISRFRAHASGGPNFAYDLCVRRITPEQRSSLDLRSWRMAFNGAEPVRAQTLARFAEAFGPRGFGNVYPCYGLAEATLFASGGRHDAPAVVRRFDREELGRGRAIPADTGRELVSSGRAWLDQRAIVVHSEQGTRCSEGEIGEIWLGGPHVAQGYWNRPEETEQTFRATLAGSGEGPFLRTGDLGFVSGGDLFIAGRSKDVVIVDGRNHYPQDIELTVEQSHPAFRAGCSAAIAFDDEGVERLVVVAEADAKADLDAPTLEALVRAARRAVSAEHEVDLYRVVLLRPGTIPKTTSGKIQRHACLKAFVEGTLPALAAR